MFKILAKIMENPLRLTEFVLGALFLLTMITQVAIPLIRDTPLFPLFSRKPRINRQINEVNEAIEEEQLLEKLNERTATLESTRQRRAAPAPVPRSNPVPSAPAASTSAAATARKIRVRPKLTRN